ncbi:MAG: thiamine-phosphate kinase [Candidatus Heimdallarchaeaceae archaeon]
MKKKSKKTMRNIKETMSDIGERKFLLDIANLVENPVLSFNDDASAIQLEDNTILVINADMLVKKTDVLPGMTSTQIGKKAVTMSVSDIVAKGVKPIGFLASVAFPEDLEVESAKEIIKGIRDQCDEYDVKYLGGDLNQGEDLIIDAISFGTCTKESLIPRIGAKAGDILYTTGYFGLTTLGFMFILGNSPLSDELKPKVFESVYDPKAKTNYLSLLQKVKVNICMDSSDGLIVTLRDLSKLNNMGIEVTEVPIHPEISTFIREYNNKSKYKFNPLVLAFGGGEEFELVFSVSPEYESLLIQEAKRLNLSLIKIGRFSDEFVDIKVTQDEYKDFEFPNEGFEHFRQTYS